MIRPTTPAIAMAASLFTAIAYAGSINVPNGSFEDPSVPNDVPYARSDIGTWQKSAMPGWWLLQPGNTEQGWYDLTGVFLNVGAAAGVDGSQAGFMVAVPGVALSQDLTQTYEVGQSYQLMMAAQGGGANMVLGAPMAIRLYYRDALNQPVVIGATTILNDNEGNPLLNLVDYHFDIPAVLPSDAWAGKPIGIEIASTVDFANAGGYWDIDNVRLTSVPEPMVLGVFTPVALVALARRRRA